MASVLAVFLLALSPTALAADGSDTGVVRVGALPELGSDHKDGYRVGSGDVIEVLAVGEADISGTYVVEHSGSLRMPYIDKVQVGGLTTDSIGSLLVEAYASRTQ